MRLAGVLGEGRGHGDQPHPGVGQSAVELRKAQVIANGHAEAAPGRFRHHRLPAGAEGIALAIGLAVGQVHVEHVDLVVGRDDRS